MAEPGADRHGHSSAVLKTNTVNLPLAIQSHRQGKGEERQLYSDHLPVVATIRVGR
jgi:hypothetical protein